MLREPDREAGPIKAWKLREDLVPQKAGLGGWIVDGPFHPAWHQWFLGMVHLRPMEGVDDAKKHYPEAEYEFMIWSIDPGDPFTEEHDTTGSSVRLLRPADVIRQFHGPNDEQAAHMLDWAVEEIVAGRASPDSDYRSWWEGVIDRSAEHYRTGHWPAPEGRA